MSAASSRRFDVRYQDGLLLPELALWLDPHRPRERAFVSHAHADHFGRHGTIICSERTRALIEKRYGSAGDTQLIALDYDEPYTLDPEHEIRLLPAGHIFGSAQLHLTRKGDGATLLYTGDFKLRQGYSSESIQHLPADTLIMETTFGLPQFRFPPTDQVVAAVVKFCRETLEEGEIPVLLGYSLGKAQEILAALAQAALPVMLHRSVHSMTKVYEAFSETFPPYQPLNLKAAQGHVLIVPPSVGRSQAVRKLKNTRKAMLSGWALQPGAVYRYQVDAVFPLSDHADYPDLLRYVRLVKPSLVYTLHGYAAEFARDLRSRGTEAWSILTDNQLDLELGALRDTGPAQAQDDSASPRPPCELATLADVSQEVAAATGKKTKVSILASYFAQLDEPALKRAARFLSGRISTDEREKRRAGVGSALLRQALLRASGMNRSRYAEISASQNDAGRTAYLVLQGVTRPRPRSLADLEEEFTSLTAAPGPLAKERVLADLLATLHPHEARLVVQILTNELRIGLKEGLLEDSLAAAFHRDPDAVRQAHMLLGNLGDTAAAARADTLHLVTLQPFQPIKCMLASPEETAEAIWQRLHSPNEGLVWLEDKLDGIRAQLHRQGNRCALFSRDLRPLDGEFPEICHAAKDLPDDVVLDGELIAYAEGKRLTFFDLQKRLGRKRLEGDLFFGEAIPVRFAAFDLLWHQGESLLQLPLHERRRRLDSLPLSEPFLRVPVAQASSAAAVEDAFKQARLRDNEGLIAKDPSSPYSPGRRGKSWLKLKKAMATLDVVVVRAEQGNGKRSHLLSDYTFAVLDEETQGLAVIGKAYSGLTDAEIETLTEHFIQHTVSKTRRRRDVEPNVILEVAFDSIQASKRHDSGVALRFPRIKAIRQDKSLEDIDTLAGVRKLAGLR